ncbi:unnamed protein product, partial [Brassica napus]
FEQTLSRNTKVVTAMRLKKTDIISSLRKDMVDKSEETSAEKQSTGPWLFFVSENGYAKRVPLNSFKPSLVGLIGSKV